MCWPHPARCPPPGFVKPVEIDDDGVPGFLFFRFRNL
jgi:hypothetical protein